MTEDCLSGFRSFLSRTNVRQVFVLTDGNVDRLYPGYFDWLSEGFDVCKAVVPAGEKSKRMGQAVRIWQKLFDFQADRHTLFLNFGGGMVSDLGGFVASTYKRGIPSANCPTTLLAMVDAAIGGKNGVNFSTIKNGIGIFRQPDFLFPADVTFLQTLPLSELRSGFGEMIKYAVIGNKLMFNELEAVPVVCADAIKPEWIRSCVDFKQDIAKRDPYDLRLRHILNFGHTVGHAVESLFMEEGRPVPHGAAVAVGMVYESRLSHQLGRLSSGDLNRIENLVEKHFPVPSFTGRERDRLRAFMQHDKKNAGGKVAFSLLAGIGEADTEPALIRTAEILPGRS